MISIERSLLKRIFVMALVLISLSTFLHQWWFSSVWLNIHQGQLVREAEALKKHLNEEQMDKVSSVKISLPNHSSHIYIVTQRNKIWSSAPDVVRSLPLRAWQNTAGYFEYTGSEGKKFLGLVDILDDEFSIIVIEDISFSSLELTKGHRYLLAISLVAVIFLMYLQRMLIVNAFSHLNLLIKEVNMMQRGDAPRLKSSSIKELEPLVGAINQLLGFLEHKSRRNRHAIGNLSHAMKTPLAVIRQVAERDDNGLINSDRDLLLQQAEQLSLIVERELKRARISGPGSKSQAFSVEHVIQDLSGTIKMIYPQKPIFVEVDCATNVVFPGDRSDFIELMGNLLDNAGKWCKSTISVTAKSSESFLLIDIVDDGPGSGLDDPSHLLQRGVRADESEQGHGLGLSIVVDIVDQYGGRVDLSNDDKLGGLRVSLMIPYRQAH
ncbi:ATP-binding protein [Pontibacterium sp.]|uniref:ATP-binding protein n=1 Tax=Pontibacterium sp. TaxID=2036026 RepID=UPI003514A626